MKWFSTHVVFQSFVGGNPGSDPLCEDRVVLFRALDEVSARAAAEQYGHVEETEYRNSANELVEWKFARAENIEEVGSEPDLNGWEVASRYFRPSDIRAAQTTEENLS